jgi:hypothetical protein
MDDERQTRILARLESAALGVPLSQRIGPPATPAVLRGFARACRQIDRAHACGLVHRDLQPFHILVGQHEVAVRGWEQAKLDDEDDATLPRVRDSRYAPPESTADARGDVYALGCILFELLAGEPLHATSGALDAARRSPRLRRPDRDIPVDLDALCVAATAPDPAHRIAAGELADRVQAGADRAARPDMRGIARAALPAYAVYLIFVPTFLWLAAGQPFYAIMLTALVIASAGLLWLPGRWRPLVFAALNVGLVVLTGRIASPYPATTVATITVAAMAFGPSYARPLHLGLLAAAQCLAVLVPFAAEQLGYLPATVSVIPDGYVLTAPVFHLKPVGLLGGFAGYVVSNIAAAALVVHALLRRERKRMA